MSISGGTSLTPDGREAPRSTVVVTGGGRGVGAAVVADPRRRRASTSSSTDLEHRRVDARGPRTAASTSPTPTTGPPSPRSSTTSTASSPNAGTTWRARVGEVALADWDRVHAVNITGALLGIQALTPKMAPGASDRHRRLGGRA